MINTSPAWKEYLNNSSVFHIKADMYDGNGIATHLTDSDFMLGTPSFTDAMSGMNEIELGAVVTNSFSATLNNFDGRFDDWKWKTISVMFGIDESGESAVVGNAVAGIAVVGTNAESVGEWIYRGFYTIDRPKTTGDTIQIECYDRMDKLNKAFSGLNATLTYPIQSNTLIQNLCTYCGLGAVSTNPFSNFTINEFEIDEQTTCRQVLSWILQTLGGYARASTWYQYNRIDMNKWSIGEWGSSDVMNGRAFSALTPWNDYRNQPNIFVKNTRTGDTWINGSTGQPSVTHSGGFCSDFISVTAHEMYYMPLAPADGYVYQYNASRNYIGSAQAVVGNKFGVSSNVAYIRFNGNTADVDSYGVYAPRSWFYGGIFNPWDEADIVDVDGGMFFEGQQPYEIERIKTKSISMDDVDITGVRAFSYDGESNSLDGTDGYILTIRDNPLVDTNNVSAVATRAFSNVDGLAVRPFEATIFGDPAMEAGDVVMIDDARGNYHLSIITSLKYILGGDMRISCDALTPQEQFNANQ